MGCNVGGLDRKLRILVGIIILLIGMGDEQLVGALSA